MRFDTTAACLFTLAISTVARADAATGETAWACRAERDAIVCESSFETLVPVPGLDEGTETGFFVLDALGNVIAWFADLAAGTESGSRGTETGFLGTETGFLGTETGFRGTETGFRGTETGFTELDMVPAGEIAAGTETGFRYFALVEWRCTVEMKPGAPEAPVRAHCATPTTRLVAAPR